MKHKFSGSVMPSGIEAGVGILNMLIPIDQKDNLFNLCSRQTFKKL